MFVLILFTIIIGVMIFIILQLKASSESGPTTDALRAKSLKNIYKDAVSDTLEHLGHTFLAKSLYSKRLIDEYTTERDEKYPQAPLAIGLWLMARPNCRVMTDIMMYHSAAKIGSVIVWRKETVRENLIMSYIMVRVNTPQRWIHIEVTHYEGESREEILVEYLKTLDPHWFDDTDLIKKSFPDGEECMIWDPSMEMLKT
jgi:hypothetical protein